MSTNHTSGFATDNEEHYSSPTGINVKRVVNFGFDGGDLLPLSAGGQALKVTGTLAAGSVSYLAVAPAGTAQSAAAWRAMKIDQTNGVAITWAGGTATYTNVATDLTTLTYS